MMNPAFEALFEAYVYANHTGELANELHKVSSEIDRQIETGDVDNKTVADYEYAAARLGFYEGLKMGLQLAFGTGASIPQAVA